MKRYSIFVDRRLWTFVLTMMLVPVMSAAGQSAKLQLPDFSQLAAKSSNTVDITLDGSLLALAARFLDGNDADERAVKEIVTGVKGIYVKSFEFQQEGGYSPSDVNAIRQQLMAPGWSRLIGVESRRDQTHVDIYLWTEGGKAGGVAILSAEPRQLTIVNIIGAIDLDKLRALEGQFGVPKFDLERRSKEERKRKDDQ